MGNKKIMDANLGWKHLSEMGNLSSGEIQRERIKRIIGLILGPVLFVILLLIQTPDGMTILAQRVLAITVWIIVWWLTEPIPIPATGFIAFLLIPLMGVLDVGTTLAYLGQSNTWLMIGIFIFAGTLIEEGFAKRMALWLLSRKFASKSFGRLLLVFTIAVAVVSAFMSHVASAMLFLVIAQGLVEAMGYDSGHPVMKAFNFSNAYASQAGGLMTPIGAANVNFVTIGLCASLIGVNIRFTDFCAAGLPSGIIMMIISFLIIYKVFKKDAPANIDKAQDYVKKQKEEMGPMTSGEKWAVVMFLLAVVLWILPSVIAAIFGKKADITATFDSIFNSAYVSIFVALLCFLIPVAKMPNGTRRPLTTWTKACKHINWGVIFLVAAGLLLGGAMNAEGVGLVAWFAKQLSGIIGGAPEILIVLCFIILEMILTQFISNIPAVSIVTTISVPVAMATGVNPIALALTICFAGQMSYVLPVASPQLAIIYGAGSIKMGEFVKRGIIITAIAIPVVLFVGYYWINLIFPYVPA